MSEWIDIEACVKLSGKSVATIRRAIKRLPDDSIKKEGAKHLYDRAVILHELGVDTPFATDLAAQNSDTVTIEHDTINDRADDTPLIEALKWQIQAQSEQLRVKDEQIQMLLDRQRETNVLLGQMRLLTTREPIAPATTGKSERELRQERIALIVAVVIVVAILAVIVWASWR